MEIGTLAMAQRAQSIPFQQTQKQGSGKMSHVAKSLLGPTFNPQNTHKEKKRKQGRRGGKKAKQGDACLYWQHWEDKIGRALRFSGWAA